MKQTYDRKKCLLIAVILLMYCYAFQGVRGLWERDEGRYTAVALRMLATNDWINPQTHHDTPHFSKPPLTYWLTAASFQIFGKNEFAARLPSSTAYLGTIIALVFLGRVFLAQNSWSAALIYAMMAFPFAASNIITTDGVLTFFETAAVASFAYTYWRASSKNQLKGILLMWLFFSFAFLTKGPPGLLPLLSILAFLFVRSKTGGKTFPMHWLWGGLIFLGIGASWYLALIFQQKLSAGYFIWNEFFLRIFSGEHKRNPEWYALFSVYLPVLLFGTLPWTYFIIKGFNRMLRGKIDSSGQSSFLLLWFLIPLSVFIIARSKLPLYMLPLFAPMAVVAARQLEHQKFSFKKTRYLIAGWMLMLVISRLAVAQIPLKADSSQFAKKLKEIYPHPIQEIFFIDRVPILGLYFYTGAEVERLSLKDGSIDEELKEERQGPRLWFVKDFEVKSFEEKIEAHQRGLKFINKLQWYNNLYHVYLDAPLME